MSQTWDSDFGSRAAIRFPTFQEYVFPKLTSWKYVLRYSHLTLKYDFWKTNIVIVFINIEQTLDLERRLLFFGSNFLIWDIHPHLSHHIKEFHHMIIKSSSSSWNYQKLIIIIIMKSSKTHHHHHEIIETSSSSSLYCHSLELPNLVVVVGTISKVILILSLK